MRSLRSKGSSRTSLRTRQLWAHGAVWAGCPFPSPPCSGAEGRISAAATEVQEWSMDLPEDPASSTEPMYLWEQPEEVTSGPLLSLEEQILNSTFEACDPHKTGTVAVTHLLAYLEAVTGQGPQDVRLQTLARSLDPYGKGDGATVELDTFLVVMRDWIAACQLHGGLERAEETAFGGALASPHLPSACPEAEEPANLESFGGEDPRPEGPATAELLSSLEDLELSNRRLAGENAKLQHSVETAEEGSARLGEEIASLRKQLRSTQQALQVAKALDEELEDLKTLAKSLEEQNRSLMAQARHTEKEQQHLVAEVETLQEENGKLLAERDGVRRRSEELATEKDALKRQLRECEQLICQREAVLSERTRHAESLAQTLEEYRTTTQELRQEISNLEEQLSLSQEGPEELLERAEVGRVGWIMAAPPSLDLEIQAIRQEQDASGVGLSSPLYGVWQWEEAEPHEETEFPSEVSRGVSEPQKLVEFVTEVPGTKETNFQREPLHGLEGSRTPSSRLSRRQEEEEEESWVLVGPTSPLGTPGYELDPGSSPESCQDVPEVQQALLPVVRELVPVKRPWAQHCLRPQHSPGLRISQHPLVPTPVLGLLLLLLLSILLLSQSPTPTWPHLQLYYLQPPPV
ncbi:protein KASH5 [Alexandromys fortis]|uniref:protein KASH5 n=1 Tax=Alexandromys fortis TaxID=100897 RepID=UPI0021539AF2|nr:protein KASH5 [Microtus fortis]